MTRYLWLNRLLGLASSRKDRRRQTAWQRRGIRPLLEALEDRITPSTVVENAANIGQLQTDLNNATATNTQYVINLTGTSANYLLGAGQELTISAAATGSSVTIAGTGQSITGNGNRVILINKDANVTLQDLTIAGGRIVGPPNTTVLGGGIDEEGGNVTLNKVAVQNNVITGTYAEGAGIYVANGGNLTIEGGSTFLSNRALGTGTDGNIIQGGGLYVNCVNGASTIVIRDSSFIDNGVLGGPGTNGASPGAAGGRGGEAEGGGVYVTGSGWNVTLVGDLFGGNVAVGGNGGNGAPGTAATAANTTGGTGGAGGNGGSGVGGAAEFIASAASGTATGTLTILSDAANPSTMIGNLAQGGFGGIGGIGGSSTGTANNANGGAGGIAFNAFGGALDVESNLTGTVTVNIGNTTFFGNSTLGGGGGTGGAPGTGGTGAAGAAGANQLAGTAYGGGISLEPGGGSFTMVNSTVAQNTSEAGPNGGGPTPGNSAQGGGINLNSPGTVVLDNNTIVQNTIGGAAVFAGAGVSVLSGNPTLTNNLIQGNLSLGTPAPDLGVPSSLAPLSSSSNNFIGSITANAVSTATNLVGNLQPQLGGVVGVAPNGHPAGGPIFYPLLPGVASIGAGSTSVLNTIASVEGTTSANATDEIGNPRSPSNSIDLGAVEYQTLSTPKVTTNPTNQTAMAGDTVSFAAAASGYPAPTVQWQVSTDGGKTFSNISGATATTLTLTNVATALNGNEYQAVFSNSQGTSTSSAATLTVNAATGPVITTQPTDQTATAEGTATFTAAASGTPAPTVQWQVSTDGGKTFSDISGATGVTLTLNNVSADMSGNQYRAVFSNSSGSTTSSAANLTVQTAPTITSGDSTTFTVGQQGSFLVTATGTPTPILSESGALPQGVTFTDNGNGTAILAGTPAAAMNGTYSITILAHNGIGSDFTQNFTLTVNPAPAPSPSPSPSPSASPSPSFFPPPLLPGLPPPPISAYQATVAFTLDVAALYLQSDPSALPLLNALSMQDLGRPLPPVSDLLSIAAADYGALLQLLGWAYQPSLAFTIDAMALYAQNDPAALSLLDAFSMQQLGQPLPPTADLLSIAAANYGAVRNAFGAG